MRPLQVSGQYYRLYPPERFAGRVAQEFEVDFDRSAFLVVDVYGHGFQAGETVQDHPSFDAESNKPWDDITLNYVRPALQAARLARMPVVYAHNSAPNIAIDRSEFGKQLGRSLQADVEEVLSERPGLVDPLEYRTGKGARLLDIAPAVAPQPGDYYVRKHFYSGFKDTRLDTLLRNLDIKTLFCVGFDASICLLCTIIDAWELNYEIVLLRDAVRAMEIPEDTDIGYSFTERITKWIEALLGRSISTQHFVELMATVAPEAGRIQVGGGSGGSAGQTVEQFTREQLDRLVQFCHPEKAFSGLPGVDGADFSRLFGLDADTYCNRRQAFAGLARQAAEGMLADADLAARVDRLPFVPGATVVGLGDSITDDLQSWLEILRHLLHLRRPGDRIRVINAGISGDTTAQIISRFLAVVLEEPDWVVCMAGTNDARRHGRNPSKILVSIEETDRNLAMLRHFAATQTTARWLWITPGTVIPHRIAAHWLLGQGQLMWSNDDLAAIADLLRRRSEPTVDLQPLFGNPADPSLLLDDGLHPSLAGQEAIARAVVEKLTEECAS
ncbi:MAG: isochorismatase family protein [Candidatus Latescibacterota bacterium]